MGRLLMSFVFFVSMAQSTAGVSYAQTATYIAGVPVYCNDFRGFRVAVVSDPYLNDVGQATLYNGQPVIRLNPNIINSLPPRIQLFWFGHECAHHALGHIVNRSQWNEVEADCWSIRLGRNQGWLSSYDIEQMVPYFINNPGSYQGHLPGPQRLQNFANCFDS